MKKWTIANWFLASPKQVLKKFSDLPNAQLNLDNVGISSYCYIPGTRKDRVVLVAHVDTVWEDERKKNMIKIAYAKKYGIFCASFTNDQCRVSGIGADDRAGCMALWALRDSGHSLLLVDGEERGLVGSRAIANATKESDKTRFELMNELNETHNFMIQFDRKNSSDLVFYDVGTDEFKKYCENSCPGYKTAYGSCSDIKAICRDICGLNISSGYYREHTTEEVLVFNEWKRTVDTVGNWLKNPLEKWKLTKPVYQQYNYRTASPYGNAWQSLYGEDDYDLNERYFQRVEKKKPRPEKEFYLKPEFRTTLLPKQDLRPFDQDRLDPMQTCPSCNNVHPKEDIITNFLRCPTCGYVFKIKETE